MFDLPISGDTQMRSSMPEIPQNSQNSDSTHSANLILFERLVRRLDDAVVGESLPDVMLAMASVIARRFGPTDFNKISHTLSSMVAVVRSDSGSALISKKNRRTK